MTLPRTIKIGPIKFKFVKNRKRFKKEQVIQNDPYAIGLTLLNSQELLIHYDLSPDIERETSLHESLHGMLALSGIQPKLGYKMEEAVVSSLSPYILMLIRNNPKYIKYLQEKN